MADILTPSRYDSIEEQHDGVDDEQSDMDEAQNQDATMMEDDEDTNERTLPNGKSYTVSEMPTDYSLFSNPPGLGLTRQRLFEIEDQIELSPTDWQTYLPFVDNVWRKQRGAELQKEGDGSGEVYWCKLRKNVHAKPHAPKPTPEGKQPRKKRAKEEKACPMAIKVVRTQGATEKYTVMRAVGRDVRHTHDLDYMDSQKRNGAIMDIARAETNRGFLPGSVYWKMWTEPDKMVAAGGKFMKVSDVRNVQYAWRQQNPDALLKAHTGYSQTRSAGRSKTGTPGRRAQIPQQSLPPQELSARPSSVRPSPAQPTVAQSGSAQQITPPLERNPRRYDIPKGALQYPDHARSFLHAYLPDSSRMTAQNRPHVTLTWASSLDSRIALMPGVQTAISGPETKAMTHYLRSRHDAIVIGVRTAIADDPSLNCRLQGVGGYGGVGVDQQPRPIIIDPYARLTIRPDMKILQIVSEGRAKAPWVVVAPGAMLHPVAVSTLKAHGGEYLMINDYQPQNGGLNWEGIFNVLYREGIRSIMIEGGGVVLSELLRPRWSHLIDSVVLTIAPTFFGRTGVEVAPYPTHDEHHRPIATRLKGVRWQPMGDADVVMCGHLQVDAPPSNGILPGIEEFSQAASSERQQHAPPISASARPQNGEAGHPQASAPRS